jgi:4-diphosphocytidyl-2-C-methyl-D-erythritol kinase
MQEIAYAKINLALHVRERRADGYHLIETVFAFAEDGDRLRVEPAAALELIVEGLFAVDLGKAEDNLVLAAARALAERAGAVTGARLILDKRLPVASGIGGGSADAAAALRLLSRWWGLDLTREDLLELAADLGADVPACLDSRTCRGEGRGDRLVAMPELDLAGAPLLLVNPRVAVSTAAVFRGWDGVDRGPLTDWETGRNDLEPAALALAPEVGAVLAALQARKPHLTRMSGSGATCFALFGSRCERDAAAAAIAAAHPRWWQLATRLR